MSTPDPLSAAAIAQLTQARLTLGPRGRALATRDSLSFALDHARAREAVLSELDTGAIGAALEANGLSHISVTSAAETRETYIKRPDLGRRLPDGAAEALRQQTPPDVALVLGDGLSAIAVALNGPAFLSELAARLAAAGLRIGPVVIARQARVALGDQIARAMGAGTVVVALGERPGLSAADSLGVYITHDPQPHTPDSARNCISNIREAGLSVAAAAIEAERLIHAMRTHRVSGVALGQVTAEAAQTPGLTEG